MIFAVKDCKSSDLKAVNDKLAAIKKYLGRKVKAFRCVVEKHSTTLKMIEISKCYPAVKDFEDGLRDMRLYCDSICQLTNGVAVIAARVKQEQFVEAANHKIAYPNTKRRKRAQKDDPKNDQTDTLKRLNEAVSKIESYWEGADRTLRKLKNQERKQKTTKKISQCCQLVKNTLKSGWFGTFRAALDTREIVVVKEAKSLSDYIDYAQRVRTQGFSTDEMNTYIENHCEVNTFPHNPDYAAQKAEQIKNYLKTNKRIENFCRIPFILDSICNDCQSAQELVIRFQNYSTTNFIMSFLCRLCLSYLTKRYTDKTLLSPYEALPREIFNCFKDHFLFMESFAFQLIALPDGPSNSSSLSSSIQYIKSIDHSFEVQSFDGMSVQQLGLVTPCPLTVQDESQGDALLEKEHEFKHAILQHFFAARFLVDCLRKEYYPDHIPRHDFTKMLKCMNEALHAAVATPVDISTFIKNNVIFNPKLKDVALLMLEMHEGGENNKIIDALKQWVRESKWYVAYQLTLLEMEQILDSSYQLRQVEESGGLTQTNCLTLTLELTNSSTGADDEVIKYIRLDELSDWLTASLKKLELNEFFNVFFKEKILSLVIECKRNDCVKEDKEALLGLLTESSRDIV